MWDSVLLKIDELKSIDRQCQAFGARRHRYELRPCLAESEVAMVEQELGVRLPDAIRAFYLEVGDGVAGPHYGLTPAGQLTGLQLHVAYPGIDALRQIAASRGAPPDEDGYFEAPYDAIAGLLGVIEEGCGHRVCLIASGPLAGNVVHVSADGYVAETKDTLVDVYVSWLDREIETFGVVRSLMLAGKSYEQINEEVVTRFGRHDAGDRIVSIADVPKPADLFGEGNHQIYHGATQFPWYEAVLKEWQQINQ